MGAEAYRLLFFSLFSSERDMKRILYTLIGLLTIVCGMECSAQTVSGQMEGHDYVDLGLPSGTKWATCNVGANTPTEYGEYFAWGETKPKSYYKTQKNSTWMAVEASDIKAKHVIDGIKDTIRPSVGHLNAKYDAATANWGEAWRMPTVDELNELKIHCQWDWTILKGINGFKVTGSNGNSIFLPAAGYLFPDPLSVGEVCSYWSSSLSDGNLTSFCIYVHTRCFNLFAVNRNTGSSIRPVTR